METARYEATTGRPVNPQRTAALESVRNGFLGPATGTRGVVWLGANLDREDHVWPRGAMWEASARRIRVCTDRQVPTRSEIWLELLEKRAARRGDDRGE
jgi:hypothetical protein